MPEQRNTLEVKSEDTVIRYPLWLLTGFWSCIVISVAVVIRRLIELARGPISGGLPEMAAINARFSSHAVLTVAHIIPALVFVLMAAGILMRPERGALWNRVFLVSGAVTGVTAYAMGRYAIGGWTERWAVLVFDSWFLFSLSRAYRFWRRGDPARRREWITRAVGILLGIATTRPVMGVFFATRAATHLPPSQFFGPAFWIGFAVNASVVEWWLHSKVRTRPLLSA